MKPQVTTAAAPIHDAQAPGEVLSRSQSPGQSKPSFRLFFFTSLSVLACALALANVASAATPSAENQYLEQAPSGGGNGGTGNNNALGSNGTQTEADVKKAAEKKKKKIEADKSDDEEGPSGAVAGAGTTPTPPAAKSVAASAKIGPFSRTSALIISALALLGGIGIAALGGGTSALFGGGTSAVFGGTGVPSGGPPSGTPNQ